MGAFHWSSPIEGSATQPTSAFCEVMGSFQPKFPFQDCILHEAGKSVVSFTVSAFLPVFGGGNGFASSQSQPLECMSLEFALDRSSRRARQVYSVAPQRLCI